MLLWCSQEDRTAKRGRRVRPHMLYLTRLSASWKASKSLLHDERMSDSKGPGIEGRSAPHFAPREWAAHRS